MIIYIKLILIFGLVALLLFFLVRIRSKIMDRIIFLLLFFAGVFFIIYPEVTNSIAHAVGISRGADLIFYLALVFFFFAFLLLYSRNKELERKLNKLVGNDAIENATEPGAASGGK